MPSISETWNWEAPSTTMRDMRVGQIAEIIEAPLAGMTVLRITGGAVSLSDPNLVWPPQGTKYLPDFAIRILPSGSEITLVAPS